MSPVRVRSPTLDKCYRKSLNNKDLRFFGLLMFFMCSVLLVCFSVSKWPHFAARFPASFTANSMSSLSGVRAVRSVEAFNVSPTLRPGELPLAADPRGNGQAYPRRSLKRVVVPPSDLHALLEAAIEAGEQLDDHFVEIDDTIAQQPTHSLAEDVTVPHEKYRTVNRYLQYGDRTARWIGNQTVLVVQMHGNSDAGDLIRRVRNAMEQTNRPAPSWELIEADLQRAASVLGQLYTTTRRAWWRVWVEACNELDAVPRDADHDREIGVFLLAMCASVEHSGVKLLSAKLLRNELTTQLRAAKARPHDEPGDRQE